MRICDITLTCSIVAFFAIAVAPVSAQSQNIEPETKAFDFKFAPLWNAISKFPPRSHGESAVPVPSASYSMIWQPEWQDEIGITAEQTEALMAIYAQALAESKQQTEQFKRLPSEERDEHIKSWGGKPSPWRQQFENEFRKQIESVLTPRQLQTLKEFSFPRYAVGLIYDADVRRQIGLSTGQTERFREVAKERTALIQEEYLGHADKVWELLSSEQQALLPELVRNLGTCAEIFPLLLHLGFYYELVSHNYPLLAEAPVRKRLELGAEQELALLDLMAETADSSQKKTSDEGQVDRDEERERLNAILTPEQLALLEKIDFRRKVVVALRCPEKRVSISFSDQQTTELQRLDKESHEALYRIDREMLEKALEVPTQPQREQLREEMQRRIGA